MSAANLFGFGIPSLPVRSGSNVQRLLVQQPLDRILNFLNRDIHDVINDPIVRGQVYGYFKLDKQIRRLSEVVEMERAWNRAAVRF